MILQPIFWPPSLSWGKLRLSALVGCASTWVVHTTWATELPLQGVQWWWCFFVGWLRFQTSPPASDSDECWCFLVFAMEDVCFFFPLRCKEMKFLSHPKMIVLPYRRRCRFLKDDRKPLRYSKNHAFATWWNHQKEPPGKQPLLWISTKFTPKNQQSRRSPPKMVLLKVFHA